MRPLRGHRFLADLLSEVALSAVDFGGCFPIRGSGGLPNFADRAQLIPPGRKRCRYQGFGLDGAVGVADRRPFLGSAASTNISASTTEQFTSSNPCSPEVLTVKQVTSPTRPGRTERARPYSRRPARPRRR